MAAMRISSESNFAPASFHEEDQPQATALALQGLAASKAPLGLCGSGRNSEKEKESAWDNSLWLFELATLVKLCLSASNVYLMFPLKDLSTSVSALGLSTELAKWISCEITLLAFWFSASKPEHSAIPERPACFSEPEATTRQPRPAQVIESKMPESVKPTGRNLIFVTFVIMFTCLVIL
jgi:hypothetical protein